ncbi:btb/poz domain-containing [Anaeramoeba flamelloides]|uniref:Btb/poz domain-containing n=1 Tax=Anaeramoeba flamelloides TaxID=1746091 RepID=A0AAV7YL48_9EUKA|nr:btb/poz domain-containing [Anaeramoeba flamelloides]KAJ6228987.1 btb/poz domain-containing [Anaeramoeba flamelloides]
MPKDTMADVLNPLINDPEIADVQFIIGKDEQEMWGHQVILACSSEMWKGMFFTQDWREVANKKMASVKLPDIEPDPFRAVLEFTYTRKVNLQHSTVYQVLYAADKFIMPGLKEICAEYLVSQLTSNNCLQLFEKGIIFDLPNLRRKALVLVEKKSIQIMKKENCFNKLQEKTIEQILKSKKLVCTEIELFRRILERGKYLCKKKKINATPENIKNEIKNLISLIFLDCIGINGLEEIAKSGIYPSSTILEHMCSFGLRINRKNLKISNEKRRKKKKLHKKEINTLLLAAHPNQERIDDVKNFIISSGITNLTIINAYNETPTAEELLQYDSIFTFSYNPYKEPVEIGDILADFVECGGGLVVCTCNAMVIGSSDELKGRIIDDGFLPIKKGEYLENKRCRLGEILIKNHPLMKNVKSFDGGEYSYHISTGLNENGVPVALYDDDTIFIAYKKKNMKKIKKKRKRKKKKFSKSISKDTIEIDLESEEDSLELQKKGNNLSIMKSNHIGTVVVLNFYPPSNNLSLGFWLAETDGAKIISNSIQFVANH